MKSGIHPDYRDVVFLDVSNDFSFVTRSTVQTRETVTWKDGKGETVHTDFGEFSADGRRMVQFKNEAGPRREFRRC